LVGDQRREQEREHRIRLRNAAIEEVRLAQASANAELQIAGEAARSLDSAVEERAQLLASLERSVQWLIATGQTLDSRIPSPLVSIKTAADRAAEIDSAVERAAEDLPESMTVLVDFAASAESRERERQLHPREALSLAYARQGREGVAALFSSIESHHLTISTALERAREVVKYGVRLSRESNPHSPEIALQAKTNSRTLLEHSAKEIPDWAPEASRTLMSLVLHTSSGMSSLLRDDQLLHLSFPVATEVRQAANRSTEVARATAPEAGHTSLRQSEDSLLHRWLVRIGWREPPPETAQITKRPLLQKEFSDEIGSGRVPAIYRELFRPEAVRDPKQLVGREEGLAAIAEARALWEEGRPVAVMISGARGSGKTSLINCALPTALHGLEVIRGEFHERLSTAEQFRGFLSHSFEIEDPGQLETFLTQRRRVVIIEELERTFLRQVGHYSAIRAIQRLVAATSRSTLWVLATNRFAYEFLNASVRLGDSFSHYIDTTRVSKETLRESILKRHYLSGLRLEFGAPPPEARWTTMLDKKAEGAVTAEDVFFDRLAHESDGVFRSAFEMWLTHVDSVEDGLLKMKPMVPEGLSPMIGTLSMSHLHTLVAILQHGSLDAEEHAVVFQKSPAASLGILDELLIRELIEPDPERPGFHVAPEARRVVYQALYQRNLL